MRRTLWGAVALGLSAASAWGHMSFISQNRFVEAGTNQQFAPNFDPFVATVNFGQGTTFAVASQNTAIEAHEISGSLSANGAWTTSRSLLSVTFSTSEPLNYSAYMSASGGGAIPAWFQRSISLSGVFSGSPWPGSSTSPQPVPVNEQGIIPPGTYTLDVLIGWLARPDFGSGGSGSFTFQVSPIPAPGAVMVLGLGALVASRRRRG